MATSTTINTPNGRFPARARLSSRAMSFPPLLWVHSSKGTIRHKLCTAHIFRGSIGILATDQYDRRMNSADLDEIAAWLRSAGYVTALTGAGISTNSGIPDFRGPNGVWTKNPDAEKAAQIENYLADPELRKRSWANRTKNEMFSAAPNPGHEALVTLERHAALHALVTQNVDGLHHAAGQDPAIVVEIHGNVREAKCMDCGWRGPMQETLDRVRNGEADPPCVECG